MDKLTELAKKYKADKWGKHHYTPIYFDLFKDKQVKKVIELGAGEGASLRMWRDFFPEAQIWGADNQPNRIFQEKRISVLFVDQTIEDDLINLIHFTGSDIDLFIDDGSHKPEDQVFTCLKVFPLLNKGTAYVIEDVADPTIVDRLPAKWKATLLRVGKRYDDQLVIIQK